MRKFATTTGILFAAAASASAQMVYEPFDYGTAADNTNFANTAAGVGYINPSHGLPWASAFNTQVGDDKIQPTGSLAVTGLAAGFGNQAGSDTHGTSKAPRIAIQGAGFTTPGTTMYYSMALNLPSLTALTTASFIAASFNNSTGTQAAVPTVIGSRLLLRVDSSDPTKYNIGMGAGAGGTLAWSPDGGSPSGFTQFNTGDTVFVVGGYTINGAGFGGTDDVQSLWVNPTASFGAGTAPTPTVSVSGSDMSATPLNSLLIRTATGTNSHPDFIRYDEIRIDQSWAQVTPKAGSVAIGASGSNWSAAGTWDAGGVPNAAESFAHFTGAGGTINVDANHDVGTMTFRSGNSYTIASTGGALNLNGGTGGASAINVQAAMDATGPNIVVAGAHTISAPLTLANNLAVHTYSNQSLTVSGGITGTGSITKTDPGTLAIQGGANFTGGITATNGTLALRGTNTYTGTTSFIGVGAAGGPANTILIESDAALGAVPTSPTTNLILSKPSADLIVRFEGNASLNANRSMVIATTGGGNGPRFDTQAFNVTINGNISGSTASNLVKGLGSGTLFLRGDNSLNTGGNYVGVIFSNAGLVNVTADVQLGRTVANGGTGGMQANGGGFQFGTAFPWAGRLITFGGTGGNLDTPTGVTQTIDTSLGGAAPWTKSGLGTLILTATNNNTSTTAITGGILVGGDAQISTLGLILNGGTLQPAAATTTAKAVNVAVNGGTLDATNATTIDVNGAGNTTLVGNLNVTGGTVNLNRSGGTVAVTPGASITVNAGATLNVSGSEVLSDGTDHTNIINNSTTSFNVTGGTHNAGNITGVGNSSASGASTLNANLVRQNALSIADTSKIKIRTTLNTGNGGTGAGASVLNSLPTVAAGAQLNLNDGKLIVQFGTNASPLAATRAAIIAGRGGTDFGTATWQGTGGIASDAAAVGGTGDNGVNPGDGISFAIGYVENSFLPALGVASYTEFGGQTVDSGSMLIRFTRGADCNLDGKVNTDDVTIVGATFGTTNAEWSYGDFDYDGVVDSDDVTVLGALYDATAPALSQAQLAAQYGGEFAAAFARGQAMAVPEPTALSLLGLGGLAVLKRRRRA